jgi:threonine/homoserine/homoserine lactone efflux protein
VGAYLLIGLTYGFAAAAQPGPLQTFFISRALAHGWLRTVPATCAPLISDGPIALLVLLILSGLPSWIEELLRVAGGLFLLYLAFSAFRSWRKGGLIKETGSRTAVENLFQAVAVNALNPAPYLGWSLVLGPLFLKGWREAPSSGVALLLGFYGSMIVSSAVIIALFASARSFGERLTRILLALSALALAALGIIQLSLAASSFLGS